MVNKCWNLNQIDVKNIFYQRTFEEKMYMTLPYDQQKEHIANRVCRLKKLIYGLK
jgi:hypothetical protein